MNANLKNLSSLVLWLTFLSFLLSGCNQTAPDNTLTEDQDQGKVTLYYFWGEGCSHCAEAKPWLARLDHDYPDLAIRAYEVWYSDKNQMLLQTMADTKNLPKEGRGTPTFFIGDRYWTGYSPSIAQDIESIIGKYLQEGSIDAGEGIMPGAIKSSNIVKPAVVNTPTPPADIDIPFVGKVYLAGQSLWISTALISFVDGFNPCSVWVLTMLLALTLHTGSRKKVTIIGVIFLTVTAGIYALFIAGLFTIFTFVSFVGWIRLVVAALSLFFAVVNIKDYFWYKEGISLTIADDKKPGIFSRIRKIMDASQSFWGLAGATVLMAAGVSLIEFSCTAGFPILWTNILVSQQVGTTTFILLLLLYLVIYQLDEMAIFFTAVYSLKASRMEEKHGRLLKLIGGMLMLSLAVVMIVDPTWMNSLSKSLIVFAFAFGLVGLVLLLHRRILPAMGIWIGSEAPTKLKKRKRH